MCLYYFLWIYVRMQILKSIFPICHTWMRIFLWIRIFIDQRKRIFQNLSFTDHSYLLKLKKKIESDNGMVHVTHIGHVTFLRGWTEPSGNRELNGCEDGKRIGVKECHSWSFVSIRPFNTENESNSRSIQS